MLSFLMIGMAFFILDLKHLMISSLFACGLLCVFLKDASHQALFYSRLNQEEVFRIVHINAASAERQYEDVLEIINTHDPDLFAIQECTPDWFYFFEKTIDNYPYQHSINLPMSFGSVLYSKNPLVPLDTIVINQIPNLVTEVEFDDDNKVTILNTYLHTPLLVNETGGIDNNLSEFISIIKSDPQSAFLHVGDFNLTYWSGSILDYRLETQLQNSRKGINLSKMYVPYDHVFYSDHLECTNFQDLELSNNTHVGVLGDYYFKYSSLGEESALRLKNTRY